MDAGTPGPQHARLTESVGIWNGKTTMWMGPGTEPIKSDCVTIITPVMDNRFIKVETKGEMPGMGPFSGFGLYGYDNVGEKFQSPWIDNHGTGMMIGTGDLSSDGATLTWDFTYNCPIAKKPVKLREIERKTGADTSTLEMYGTDPKSGKEYKMMEIALIRVPGSAARVRTAAGDSASALGATPALMIVNRTVDAGCGQCVYHMADAKTCALAVKIDGKPYLVTGATSVDSHQFCSAAKPVLVTGRIFDGKFIAEELVLSR
jgi:hypothetical protein